ncbi:hypothetical protein HPP05_42835 [Corallococcus exiguus]|uniref:hypothetical protein n=1 Tax=Corallococcus exiguus TaxID=83462 RepID=UPI0011C3A846|nr:hypothetical protein [Corallococcus exiguus]NPC76468.1 hypothetical protein [Corallococcus exiguus]NRD51187.1 hypothetical protein [Corallococcus exiguus]
MSRSFLMHTALSSAAVATVLLAGCDPICMDGVSKSGQGQVTRSASGTCVQLVVTRPDAGEEDGGSDEGDGGALPDSGTDGGECGAGPGWTTRVLDEGIDIIISAFVFDAQGVGHYAYSKNSRLHVGTTRPGDVPVRLESVWTAYDVYMAVATDGTHHVLFQQGNNVGYAHDTGGIWRSQVLREGWAAAITLDAQDAPHLLIGRPYPQVGYLHGTRSSTGSWDMAPLEAVGAKGDRERMAVDAAGHVHIVFVRMDNMGKYQVVYASNTSGAWLVEPLDWRIPLSSPRYRIALEVDSEGRPSVVGSDTQGAWLWTKEASGWTSYGLGAFLSRGPALSRNAAHPTLRNVLLDDADANADFSGSTSQLVVKALYGTSSVGSTLPLTLETLDGGNALPASSAVHMDAQDRLQVGFSYVHYYYPPDGGTMETTRGLRYARYCP